MHSELDLKNAFQRLEVLEAERSILRTLYAYAHCIGYGLEQDFVDLFVDDGVFQHGKHRHLGRAELATFIAAQPRPPASHIKHLLVNPVITLHGDEAEALSYYARVDDGPNGPFIYSFGRYRDRLVKCADHKWRFKERVTEREAIVRERR